ncbi:helical backbone metal receptor [Nannocystis punicea]|uniref:Helical backbone metal receptor n=1 Tax=Nannocystis punicea TaxID=2995304 RepID=A0ABY7HG73_9BACT|nr:helical backbone metal receptor [Nannocystis poenicansa]WAS98308.1 helical backbone metal receptor [Nannocystis poenicansa]
MRKPEHQWETRRFVAVRSPSVPPPHAAEEAVQAFELRPRGGGDAPVAVFSLGRQMLPRAAVEADPDLLHAARAWLAARGSRELRAVDEENAPISSERFTLSDLGSGPSQAVRKVITLAPSNAELVASLGCFDRVIACEDSSDSPPETAKCERLGPDLGPDLDRVAELRPDLVFSSLSVPGMERIVTGLRARGVPQRVLAPRSIADVIAEVRLAGADLEVQARAEEVVATMEAEAAALRRARPPRAARVYLEWWPRPMFTPGAACFSNNLIELAGGVNVFADRPGASVEITAAELVAADPDICFVSWCGVAVEKLDPENLIRRPGLEALRAARAGRVVPLDERYSGRPGPHMLEAARIMARAIASP